MTGHTSSGKFDINAKAGNANFNKWATNLMTGQTSSSKVKFNPVTDQTNLITYHSSIVYIMKEAGLSTVCQIIPTSCLL